MSKSELVARSLAIKLADHYERLNKLKSKDARQEKEMKRLEEIKNLLAKVGVK